MKEFFSNPKNRPIVISASVVVIVLVVLALLYETGVFAPRQEAAAPSAPVTTTVTVPRPVTAMPATAAAPVTAAPPVRPMSAEAPPTVRRVIAGKPTAKGAKGVKGRVVVASVTAKSKATKPAATLVAGLPASSRNPFQPSYNPKTLKPKPPSVIAFIPEFNTMTRYLPPLRTAKAPDDSPSQVIPPDVNLGRVSGIILSNGVHAIYQQIGGQAAIVQPGDELPDGDGRVQSIQSDGITVRLTDNQIVRIQVSGGTG